MQDRLRELARPDLVWSPQGHLVGYGRSLFVRKRRHVHADVWIRDRTRGTCVDPFPFPNVSEVRTLTSLASVAVFVFKTPPDVLAGYVASVKSMVGLR